MMAIVLKFLDVCLVYELGNYEIGSAGEDQNLEIKSKC
jgi:hypothetical protein